jgi:hypothetical protein
MKWLPAWFRPPWLRNRPSADEEIKRTKGEVEALKRDLKIKQQRMERLRSEVVKVEHIPRC